VRLGLVDRVVPQNKSMLHETLRISRVIRQQSSASVLAAKRWGGFGSGRVPAAYSHVDPDDFSESVRAFLEQRPPDSTKPRTSLRSRSHFGDALIRGQGVSRTLNLETYHERTGERQAELIERPTTMHSARCSQLRTPVASGGRLACLRHREKERDVGAETPAGGGTAGDTD
jgi:hypothetical protein